MNLTRLITTALFTPYREFAHDDGSATVEWGVPLYIEGHPGTGKTSLVKYIAAMYGMNCYVASPAEKGEAFFGVTPAVGEMTTGTGKDKKTVKVIDFPQPSWMPREFGDGSPGILFLDELPDALPVVHPALNNLLISGECGGSRLHNRVRRIACGNPAASATGGYEKRPATQNRICQVTQPDVDVGEWMAGFVAGSWYDDPVVRDAKALEAEVLAKWPDALAWAKGLVGAFLQRRGDLLMGKPKSDEAWPSPRSWENATRLMAAARIHGCEETERDALVSGCVGDATVVELMAFIRDKDLPDPADLADGKATWKHDKRRLDRTYIVTTGLAALVTADRDTKRAKKRAGVTWNILGEVLKSGGAEDLLIQPASALVKKGYIHTGGVKEAQKVLAVIQPVLAAAGIS